MLVDEMDVSSEWSWEQDKAFESALVNHPEDAPDRWEKIATDVPGKTIEEIKQHYELLVEDINQIESCCVPLPSYNSSSDGSPSHASSVEGAGEKGGRLNSDSNHGTKTSRSDLERRKGIAWTEDEHRLFLLGLEKYGKGDWRSISRNFVLTRNPTQVASHAQKYFIRLNSMNKDRRRSSIHDITSVNNGDVSASQVPITGQTNDSEGNSTGKPGKEAQMPPASIRVPSIGIHAAPAIGKPIGGPLVSAVGTPINLPAAGHMAYGVRASISGAPMNISPMAYPMSHTSAPHR
ncbi:PREDICTED: transcription factor DIVARICATA-like [Lupinus angustifolius]|uniref:transcription factor DIVARICATA-like n=1 Tax=Lupinus angustifolius TaxID=3871 RepID=UPI00092EAAC5|nr:PREDICTED: transcription factor DIVARICATA-like [Lupinus angustifolius]